MDFNGFQRISMDFNGFQWISMDFNGFQWISMDFNGFVSKVVSGLVAKDLFQKSLAVLLLRFCFKSR